MPQAAACEVLLDLASSKLGQCNDIQAKKDVLQKLVQDLVVHGGYAAESDALKQTLESLRPQVASNRLRFDQILKAGVAQVQEAQQQLRLSNLWSQSNPALAASPGEGDAISHPAAKAFCGVTL